MMNLINLFLTCTLCFLIAPFLSGQENQNFLFTKGDNNISTITMGSARSAHCTVVEYPDFLVVHEIPNIPNEKNKDGATKLEEEKAKPLLSFIDSIYLDKPIKYILNSHHHSHSLSTITPFLEKGAILITAQENIEVYNKRGLFGNKTSSGYSESIIQISSDTVLLAETNNPIEVLYLKKSDYASIPTETYLFFNFPKQNLLATSCMVYLKDIGNSYGYKSIVYNNRLVNVNEIIADKRLQVENTLQLFKFSFEEGLRKPPVFPVSHLENVLKHGWHRRALSEHFQSMSYEDLTTKRDSLLDYLVESEIYHIIVNHAVYELIDKREYQKAVALAQILVIYTPDELDYIDSLGEAYYNNGQMGMAKYYDRIISESKTEELGWAMWESNKKNRLKNGS